MQRRKPLVYVDENYFNKQLSSLRKYFMHQYKYLIFDFFKNGIFKKESGKHIEYLQADRIFERVYGKLQLEYEVKDTAIVLLKITPTSFLIEGQKRELSTYKGVPYVDEKDKKKIELVIRLEKINEPR